MKIFLLNDTANIPHIGCQAVSDAHARLLGTAGHEVIDRYFCGELRGFASTDENNGINAVLENEEVRSRLEACDALIVNGEGTLHHGAGSEYFAFLGAAQRLGKVTAIVNAVFEAHSGWNGVLSKLDDFCVRDIESFEHAQAHGFKARLVPDSFLAAEFNSESNMDLANQIVVTDWHPARDHDVGETLRHILNCVDGCFYYPLLHGMQRRLWSGAMADWSSCESIITARHHGVYLAAKARKPFVALPSNTRKIEGLIRAAGAAIPICISPADVLEAFEFASRNLGEYERLFDWLEGQLPLSTFHILGQGSATTDPEREITRLAQHLRSRHNISSAAYWGLRNGSALGLHSLG